MSIDAKTIQIFIPDGEPQGLRTAEITTRIVRAIQVPRTRLAQFYERPESNEIGCYLLFGEKDESAKPVVYIGQTEDLVGRLKNHHANKEFWRTAVVITSRTQSFTQAHLRYLEWLSIQQATEAGRYALDNGNAGGKPFVPEPMEADVLDAFDTAGILIATLGFPVFEPAVSESAKKKLEVFYCNGPDAEGRGALVEDGFVVFKGSLTRREPVPSASDFIPWLEQLEASGVLEVANDQQYRLTQDYVVGSPSYAAALVLARNVNGWITWKRKDGTTLHDVYRVDTVKEDTSTDIRCR